ncbi:hypothetical protein LR013_03415 [candidate division NPL-UPA2 bacterium]|nr:hypothetical protein [candidate division NPL-UPA2 bacterium]
MERFNLEEVITKNLKAIESFTKRDKRFKKQVKGKWSSGEDQLCYIFDGGNKPMKTLLLLALEDQEEVCGLYGCVEAIRVLQQGEWNIKAFIIPVFDKGPNIAEVLKGEEVNSYDDLKLATKNRHTIFKPKNLKLLDTAIEELLVMPLEDEKLLIGVKPDCIGSKQVADGVVKYLKDKVNTSSFRNILLPDFGRKMVYVAILSKLELPWFTWNVLPTYGCYHLENPPPCVRGVKKLLQTVDIFMCA